MVDLSPLQLVVLVVAGLASGVVNAVAGGGTLISFPVLTAVGLPAVAANVTNTVALSPGYISGAHAQREDLAGQRRRVWVLAPVGVVGGVVGGILLLVTGEELFRRLVPWLILAACGLLAAQPRVQRWVAAQAGRRGRVPVADAPPGPVAVAAVAVASVYGGYFGAGLGIILLAVLGAVLHDDLVRVNALKQVLSIAVNVAATVFFVFSGRVVWAAAVAVAVGALLGGRVGGRLVRRLPAPVLRGVVITVGVFVATVFFAKP